MRQIVCDIDPFDGLGEESLRRAAASAMGKGTSDITTVSLDKFSLDVRSRVPVYRCQLSAYLNGEKPQVKEFVFKDVEHGRRVIVVGAGPAGLFASLKLLERGIKPVIMERGTDVHQRKRDVADLSARGVLNVESNYCFGEGGAGTFSDGKLFTRSTKRGDVNEVLSLMVAHGADPIITAQTHAHIGSDKLPEVIENIRNTLLEHGAEYHFNSKVSQLIIRNGKVCGVADQSGNEYLGEAVILATGHSAKDVYNMLLGYGVAIEPKGYALGVRVEHPQALINDIQYSRVLPRYRKVLPTAAYSLVSQVDGRGVFSFCMCPGGFIVPSLTEENTIVLNGMSNSRRNGPLANAGVVVSVNPTEADTPQSWLEKQCEVERRCFAHTGSYQAPAQRMVDFVNGKLSAKIQKSSYRQGVVSAPLNELLPPVVARSLQQGFVEFNKKMHGYLTQEALLLGVESRTSSPLRIVRDPETLESVSLRGLYPCGEGAGYSGGIVSSAIDGINAANVVCL